MATFVANLAEQDQQLDQIAATNPAKRHDAAFTLGLVSSLTVFSVAVSGYHPYAEDGGLYLAGVKRLLDPALYPRQTAFVLEPMRFSQFAWLLAALVRLSHLSLPVVALAIHLASIWATLFAAWLLTSRCWPSRSARAGAVMLLACWLALPVAGTALVLMDPYLTARSISTPCMIFAMVAALDFTAERSKAIARLRAFLPGVACIGLAALMHPLMAAYALAATALLVLLRSGNPRLRRRGTAFLIFASLLVAACMQLADKPEPAAVVRVALTRTYWFPAEWAWYELLGLAAPLAILSLFARRLPSEASTRSLRALAQTALLAGGTACLAAAFFAHASAPSHLIARLQPLRMFQFVYLVMTLFLGAALGEHLLRRSASRWAITTLLLGAILFIPSRAAFPNSSHLELPGILSPNEWVQAFLWIRDNTPKDALFALDADYINSPGEDAQCFRAIAERSALPDYSKDGGEASIAPQLTSDWTQGQLVQQLLSAPATTDAERLAALEQLGVSWLVLDANVITSFRCPYTNRKVKVCVLQ